MAMTTTAALTTNPTGFYDRRLQSRLRPKFIYLGYGDERTVPNNSGATTTIRRYNNLAAATTPLVEGVTPAGVSLTKSDMVLTVAQYGSYLTLTDWLDMTGLDPKIIRPLDIVGDQAGDTFDQLARNAMNSGLQVAYSAGSAARTAVDDKIKAGMLDWAVNLLRRTRVEFIREKVQAGSGVGTLPLLPGYIFIGHTDLDADVRALAGFVSVEKYAQPGKAMENEIGSVGFTRFILHPEAKVIESDATMTAIGATGMRSTDGSYVNVYLSILFGKDFFANSKINGQSLKTIIKSFGSAGSADPLDQRSTVGWKGTYGGGITDDRRAVRFETCASALTTTQSATTQSTTTADATYKSFLT
jgi:N4-gp56 family major capsid protein